MFSNIPCEVRTGAVGVTALDDAHWTLIFQVHLHVAELKNGFTDTIGVAVVCLVGTAQQNLVKQLPYELVTFFEATVAALRTLVFH